MPQIGFVKPPQAQEASREISERDCLLRFDSGKAITFEDGRHHTLVLGTTGAGKTASVVHPALRQLIMAGYCGLVVDVKGNMRAQVRALAKSCGREGDVVEFGSMPSATPLNLLRGMDEHAVCEFFTALVWQRLQGNLQNADWWLKGINQSADGVYALRLLAAKNPAFVEPTLVMIAELVNDLELGARVFRLFMLTAYDENDKEQRRFVRRIKADEFHLFNYDAKKAADTDTHYAAQVTWNLQGIRMAVRDVLAAPGVRQNLFAQGAPGLDAREQNKIVQVCFGQDTGLVGAWLARIILSQYYKAVHDTGLTMAEGRYSFVCLDEFQDFADLSSSNRFSDANFIAWAREFKVIFLASTQSMAALANRGDSMAAVNAFVSNCNNRVLFYSDDPYTQEMAGHYDPKVRLNTLQPGEAFVCRYDSGSRKHAFGMEMLAQAYENTREILKQQGNVDQEARMIAENVETASSLLDRVEQAEAALEAAEKEKKLHKKEQAAMGMRYKGSSEDMDFEPRSYLTDQATGSRRDPGGLAGRLRAQSEDAASTDDDGSLAPPDDGEASRLYKRFPQFFARGGTGREIPTGWLDCAENAFAAFADSGLKLTVEAFGLENGALTAAVVEPRSGSRRHMVARMGERLLNALLRGTRGLCPLCGSRMDPTGNPETNDDGGFTISHEITGSFAVCRDCLTKHRLPLPPEAGRTE